MKNNRVQIFLLIAFIILISILYKNLLGHWIPEVLNLIMSIAALFIAILIFFENRHPATTITWLLVLILFPLIGFVLYFLIGRNYRKKKMFKQKAIQDEQAFSEMQGSRILNEKMFAKMGDDHQLLFRLAHKLGKTPISFQSQSQVLTDGEQTFRKIIKCLQEAKEYIHLEYYIVRDDQIGRKIKDILIEKVKEGVEVRFLYDAVGSWQLPAKYIDDLRNAGVQMVPFFPVVFPFFNNKINFRNHRKIIVIDGKYGFIGGLNIGDEYLGKDDYFGYWRDTHLFVRGEIVRSLHLIFIQDWFYMTNEKLLSEKYTSVEMLDTVHTSGIQMVAGGPDHEWEVIKSLFFAMIVSARKSIWIASPYFIPDDDILSALKIASLAGIDVRLLVPSSPDKKIVFYASRSYFPELMEAGVRIFEYQKGFLHSKVVIVDGELASIGTSNMDMRSFHLNFEVNAFLYRTESTEQLVQDFINDIEASTELHVHTFKNRSFIERIIESTSRLLSPLL